MRISVYMVCINRDAHLNKSGYWLVSVLGDMQRKRYDLQNYLKLCT